MNNTQQQTYAIILSYLSIELFRNNSIDNGLWAGTLVTSGYIKTAAQYGAGTPVTSGYQKQQKNHVDKLDTDFWKGVVIHIEIITLYDPRNKRIGNIYPRRAKQLVLTGRAIWLEEGHSLQMISDASSAAILEEEIPMTEDTVYLTNDNTEVRATTVAEVDSVLLYQARLNVKDKGNLIKHLIAYAIAVPVLGIFFYAVLENATHPQWWRASRVFVSELGYVTAYLPEEMHWRVHEAIHFADRYFGRGHTPTIWYVIVGAMLAWGGWILHRIIKRVAKPIARRFRNRGKAKLDPVMEEYNRLKREEL